MPLLFVVVPGLVRSRNYEKALEKAQSIVSEMEEILFEDDGIGTTPESDDGIQPRYAHFAQLSASSLTHFKTYLEGQKIESPAVRSDLVKDVYFETFGILSILVVIPRADPRVPGSENRVIEWQASKMKELSDRIHELENISFKQKELIAKIDKVQKLT